MRTKKMRGLYAIIAILVMAALCFADIEPEVTVVVVEPNDPNWTPSDCFVPELDRVTLQSVQSPDEGGGYKTTRILSIYCNLYKADTRNLISNIHFLFPAEAQAVDDQNNVYTYENQRIPLIVDTRPSYSPTLANMPAHISLNFPMDPNKGYPVWLSEISWKIKGLFAHAIRTVKIPFQASDQWIELLPGYSIMIEEAVLEEDSYSYRIKGRYEGLDYRPSSHLFLIDNEPVPQYMDMGMTFLDANGIDVRSYGGSGSSSMHGSGSGKEYTESGRGSCGACGGVKTIQFKFAVEPYIADMSYVLNDIPVPTF